MKKEKTKINISKGVLFFAVFYVIFFSLNLQTASASDPWYNSSWLYRVKITVNTSQVPSTQTGFPVYVNLADLPAGFFSHVKSDGSDIRVTNSSGTTELPREVVAISTGSSSGEMWFKADSISDSSYFYIYYGNSGASDYLTTDTYGRNNVWDSNYQMVVHMNENATNTTVNDSAGHVTNITTTGNTNVYHDTGQVNSGFNINTSGQGMKLNNPVTINSNHTVSVWVKQTSLSGYQNVFANGSAAGYWILNGKLSYYSGGDHTQTTADTINVWTYLTATMDGTTLRFYRNGSPDGSTALATTIAANGFGGDAGGSGERMIGSMDEEQISSIARSADWIKTEYNNQSSPSGFYSAASEEAFTTAPYPPTGLYFTAPGSNQVSLSWTTPAFNGGSNITDYVVEYKLSSEPTVWSTFNDGVSSSTSATVTGLTTGLSYDFRVSAVNSIGQGAASGTTTATPGAAYYSVTYNGNHNTGGSAPQDNNIYPAGATVTALDNTSALVKNGYAFSGWNTAPDGSGTDIAASSTFSIGSANLNLYAKWTFSACTATGGTITTSGIYVINTFTSSGTFTITSGSCSAQVLVVGGGGGSGGATPNAYGPGGGGAGGLVYNPSYPVTQQAYTVTVGDGGNGGAAGNNYGSNGQNSVFDTLTAFGGGGGAGNDNANVYSGNPGGSGGGGSRLAGLGGASTGGQGNSGGRGNDSAPNYGGGGGGGSGSAGSNATSATGGAGGSGTSYSISGSSVTYAAGGKGGSYAGGYNSAAGGANTGNGADAGSTGVSNIAGAKGGSGIVIVRYMQAVAPDAPTNLSTTPGSSQVSLSWTAPIFNGGANITDYVIEYKLSSEPTVWSTFNDGVSSSTSATVTGLTTGQSYDFRVSAANSVGQGAASATATAIPGTVPDAPTIGIATASSSQATITFTPSGNNGGSAITGYTVTSDSGSFTATGTSSPLTVTGLSNGVTYTFTVVAVNNLGTSTPSSASNAVTPADVPGAPTNLAATVQDSSMNLSWSAPASNGGSTTTDYVIEYKLTSGGTWTMFNDGINTNSTTTVTGLSNDNSYDFRVSAKNAVGTGSPSSIISATPGAPAQVIIQTFPSLTVPNISTAVRITNEGSSAYEYQYTWCVTDSVTNFCGGGDDIFSSTAAKLIQPGQNFDTTLNSTVPDTGNFWFHINVQFGSDSSEANQSFTAAPATQSPPPSGGGGGGGGSVSASQPVPVTGQLSADFNHDGIVDGADFSILLAFWKTSPPFKNPAVDINHDGVVDSADFSILLSEWTIQH